MNRLKNVTVLASGLLVMACVNPNQPTPIPNTQTQTTTVNINPGNGPGVGVPSPGGQCPAVTSVGNGLLGTGGVRTATIKVNQSITLDTTPKSNNLIRPTPCDDLSRPSWTIAQSALVCELNNSFVYTPQVTGKSQGQCSITASVDGVKSDQPIVITVVP